LFINYHLIIVLLKQSPAAQRIHLPAGRRAGRVSTHNAQRRAAHRNGCGPAVQISSQIRSMAANSSNINPMDYHVWCAMLEAYYN